MKSFCKSDCENGNEHLPALSKHLTTYGWPWLWPQLWLELLEPHLDGAE